MPARRELKEWTVMFYLASDNPLAPGVISHLKAMKSAGYHPQVNVLAQFDPHGESMPTHIFDVNRVEKLADPTRVNIGFGAKDSFVRNLMMDKLWDRKLNKTIKTMLKDRLHYTAPIPKEAMQRDNPPKTSLDLFLKFCRAKYPARHYMLFVLGHGLVVAGDVFLFDENTGESKNGAASGPRSLTLKELGDVLGEFNKEIKGEGELELIGFHSCSMSGAEVAFELQDKANYMLAAQGPAYVGIWPYRQILIRLFNDLGRSVFCRDDLENNGLIDKLKNERGPTYDYIRGHLEANGTKERLSAHVVGQRPEQTLVLDVAQKLECLLSKPDLINEFQPLRPLESIGKLIQKQQKKRMNEDYLKWLNRQWLMGGLTAKAQTAYTKANIKRMLISVFKYCYFNGIDFQLAGYSSDLTLCNLRKIDTLREPVRMLVTALTQGLEATSKTDNSRIRDLLVLAHWESQSFYDEKYSDLYDFCFCLDRKCGTPEESDELATYINNIKTACGAVMDTLKRGSETFDEGVIVRSEYCGPAYQYAHGLSVYFPWSEPINNHTWKFEYQKFKFNNATNWRSFLKVYFEETLRETHGDEVDERDTCSLHLNRTMLNFLEDISTTNMFNDEGQLKIGSKDPMGPGKSGSLDPTGDDCDCGSIKNHPVISHARHKPAKRFKGHRPIVNMLPSFEKSFPVKRKR
jgi:hypothetical protein